jgi:polygalacturonase
MNRINLSVLAFVWVVLLVGAHADVDANPVPTVRSLQLVFDVQHFGARPDGVTLSTVPIQQAIDACAAAGGGTVRLSGGRFLTGTVYLRSHVTIEIEAGATLLGSTNIAHYPVNRPGLRSYTDNYVDKSLIAGENLENVGLVGRGLIDGQGSLFKWPRRMPPFEKDRPYLIRLVNCRDVRIEGLRLQDSAMWMQHYLGCERITIRGIHVRNYHNQCNDGLDLDGCKDCTVSGCVFECDDDGITLKSTSGRSCENIVISDCVVRSHASAIKLGTESNGGFKNITITNCVVTSPLPDLGVVNGVSRGLSGIALELVDGGRLERVAITNITIHGVTTPLFLRLGDRAHPFMADMPAPPPGSFKDVAIANIVATDVGKTGCSITGLPGHPIENVMLSNLMFTFEGGGALELASKQVPELPKDYPECTMFGDLPAYGFYGRHVVGLRFSNVQLRTSAPDLRHAMVFDDVADLAIDGLDAASSPEGPPVLRLTDTRGAIIRGCQHRAKTGCFLKIAGENSRDIALVGNDLAGADDAIEVASDVPRDALRVK